MKQYIGIPYSLTKFNCWDFVVKVRRDHGLHCNEFKIKKLRDGYNLISSHLAGNKAGFAQVDELINFDIILSKKEWGDESIFHCGIFFNNRVYHCDRQKGQVTHDSLDDFIGKYEGVTFWR